MSSLPSFEEKKIAPRLVVDVAGTERTLFMSFGLLNELAALVGGPEAVPNLSFNAGLARTAIEICLAPRDKHGNIPPAREDDGPIIPVEFSPASAEAVLDWVADHVLDFFIRQLSKSATRFAGQANNLVAVGSSLTSSANSAGKTA